MQIKLNMFNFILSFVGQLAQDFITKTSDQGQGFYSY